MPHENFVVFSVYRSGKIRVKWIWQTNHMKQIFYWSWVYVSSKQVSNFAEFSSRRGKKCLKTSEMKIMRFWTSWGLPRLGYSLKSYVRFSIWLDCTHNQSNCHMFKLITWLKGTAIKSDFVKQKCKIGSLAAFLNFKAVKQGWNHIFSE